MNRESSREIIAFLVVGFAAFLGVCLWTQDPRDWLGRAPGEPIENIGGRLGALLAFEVTVWVGKTGAWGLTLLVGFYGVCLFFRRSIRQWGWKLAGAGLAIVTLAGFEVAVFDLSGGSRTYPGGHYGTYIYDVLLSNLSSFGTWLILLFSSLVAFIISTDTVLYPAVSRSTNAVLDKGRWSRAAQVVRDTTPSISVPRFTGLRAALGRIAAEVRASRDGSVATKSGGSRTQKKKTAKKAKATPRKRPARSRKTDLEDPLALKVRGSGADEDAPEDESDELDEGEELEATAAPGAAEAADEELDDDEYEEEDAEEDEDEEGEEYEEEDAEEDEDEEELEDDEEDADAEDEDEDAEDETEDGATASADAEEGRSDPRPSGAFKIREPDELTASKSKKKRAAKSKSQGPYNLPKVELIEAAPLPTNFLDKNALTRTAGKIETTLQNFKIDAQVVEAQKGPTITQFEISLAPGIKVHKIVNLADDLAMALEAQSIRIIAPIPGKSTVGIEVPNARRSMVGVRELIEVMREDPKRYNLPLALGRDTAGNPVIGDLGEMPHLLIAGSTGSGKSVCINSIIVSVLMTRTPDEVKMILVDPKMVELAQFEKIPHLLSPVVTDMKKAPAVLNWLVDKMEERYELLAMAGVRHITSYNELGREKLRERLQGKLDDDEIEEAPERLPFVVVIIDELADLMMTAAKEVEGSITRLSQKSRAVGIHVILATQRPSVDVITGLIKANMPSRVSFRVTSRVDSRTILDRNGADKLLGKGDCLFLPPGTSDVLRVQGAYISDGEIRSVVQAAAAEAEPQYNPELTRFGIDGAADGNEEDDLFEDAVGIVLGSQRGSVTLLQRQLQIGYTRASRLMELMCERGLVGPFQGSKAREVYYTLEEWEKSKSRGSKREPSEDEAD